MAKLVSWLPSIRQGRYGEFIGCSNYPKCTYIKREAIMPCPRPGCGGDITERRSGRGRVFYKCTNTDCETVYWDRPVTHPCPSCGAPFTLQKTNAQGEMYHYCADKENCGWTELPAEKRKKKDPPPSSKKRSASEAA